jgi:hypothetical protein
VALSRSDLTQIDGGRTHLGSRVPGDHEEGVACFKARPEQVGWPRRDHDASFTGGERKPRAGATKRGLPGNRGPPLQRGVLIPRRVGALDRSREIDGSLAGADRGRLPGGEEAVVLENRDDPARENPVPFTHKYRGDTPWLLGANRFALR